MKRFNLTQEVLAFIVAIIAYGLFELIDKTDNQSVPYIHIIVRGIVGLAIFYFGLRIGRGLLHKQESKHTAQDS
jgi:hypothetical protein